MSCDGTFTDTTTGDVRPCHVTGRRAVVRRGRAAHLRGAGDRGWEPLHRCVGLGHDADGVGDVGDAAAGPGGRPRHGDIKGKLEVGKNLKAKTAGWSPADVTYTYQWLRNGKVIKKATGKKYKLTNKDKGKKLQVVVTATKAGYTPATVTSKKTKKIKE